MNNIFISVYEKSLPDSLSLSEKLKTAADAGYNGLEISMDESNLRLSRLFDPRIKADTLKEIRGGWLPIRTMCLSAQRKFPFGSRSVSVREKSLEIIKRAVDFSCEAGIRIIQIPGYDVYYEEGGTDTADL